MNKTKDEKLNEEHVNNNTVTNQKEDKNMRRRTMVTVFAMMMMALLAGCGKTPQPNVTVGTAADPTPTAAPTEEVVAPTEVEVAPTVEVTPEATPTEVVVDDNPNVIEGVDFTSYNEEGFVIGYPMYEMKFDVPRLVVTRRVEMSFDTERNVVEILSDGDKFTEEPIEDKPEYYEATRYDYHIYAPKEIKDVSYNQRKIEYSLEGVDQKLSADLINSSFSKEWEMDGIVYPKVYHFYLEYNAVVTDEEIVITIDYEDGTSDQMTVYITKEYVE